MGSPGKNESGIFKAGSITASFKNAFSGILILLRSENNARIHVMIMILVIIAGFILKIAPAHWIAVILAASMVLTSECINTSIEYLCDVVSPDFDLKIKKVKDLSAAGVLISAIAAAITGLIIFIPALVRFLQ